MTFHSWGDKNVDWSGIEDAASEIGAYLVKWGRMAVFQTKEKFGTARVYCNLGWSCLHGVVWPRRWWIHKWWPYYIDLLIFPSVFRLTNYLLVPYQKWLYRRAYRLAICKRPHLRMEILDGADYPELLEDL